MEFTTSTRLGVLTALLAPLALACGESTPPPASPTPYPGPYAQAAPPYPQQPYAAGPTAPQPGYPQPQALAPVPFDPINQVDLGYLRGEAQGMLNELVATLPPPQQARVQGIPLLVDSTPGEVNAFATCSNGSAAMAITDGLLDIEAHLSDARATDELFGTQKLPQYIALVAQNQRPKQPVVEPAANFFDPAQQADGRKVARQHQLLDEQIGFVLGHELAHHYLGHLPCTSAGATPLAQLGQLLSSAVPLFNQPNEVAADMSGINTLLTLGFRRSGYHLTEGGALVTMQFFEGLDQLSPIDILFAFENTHPAPQLRVPIIQQTANAWRGTGGQGLPYVY